ncbi:MAG: delta-lactam-biosynthetic de-N-acetylase [Syntrophomonadaceae bacterium]
MKNKSSKLLAIALILIILGCLAGCKSAIPPAQPPVNNSPGNNIGEPAAPSPAPEPAPAPEPTPAPEPNPPGPLPSSPETMTRSWWFTRNKQHQIPAVNQEAVQLLSQYNGFYCLPNNSKKIYLTFDNGYELGYTSTILDILDRKGVKAAFFITGQFIETQPDLVKRMHAAGHLVCSHTWNHPDLSTVSQETFNRELTRLEQRYTELTGDQLDRYLRPPMGNYSVTSLRWADELGYRTVFWSIAFQDWDPSHQPGAAFSYQHVMDNIHPGAVILLHAVSQSNTEALEKIITDLRTQGYNFSTFDR